MSLLIRNATIINEGRSFTGSVLVVKERIAQLYPADTPLPNADVTVDGCGKWLIPGAIDSHVHFREPGAPQKGSIATESAAAVAGGVTSYMDMPNNDPPCCSIPLLNDKYRRAAATSHANYAFYLGANHNNIEDIKRADPCLVPGVKLFLGSSTGGMLVDKADILERIFKEMPLLIAVHCEDKAIIQKNLQEAKERYGHHIPADQHPIIRSREACFASTQKAIDLALKYQSRLHILHLTTKEEVELLATICTTTNKITGEVCVHHLYYTDNDYADFGNLIKCNPAVKSTDDREALREAVRNGIIKVVTTDHAPHTLEEKQQPYLMAPSGVPLIQHSLPLMFGLAKEGIFTPQQVVAAMCHAPAINFGVAERGFIREGYYADLVLLDPNPHTNPIHSESLYYQCGWTPLSRISIPISVSHTFVNGQLAYSAEHGIIKQRYALPLRFTH